MLGNIWTSKLHKLAELLLLKLNSHEPSSDLFIISGLVIFLVAFDIAKRERFNAFHFLVFLAVGSGLLVFTLFPKSLEIIGQLSWLQRGADALVYASIIFLFYFVLLLLQKVEATREELTRLVRELAIQNAKNKIVFLIRAYNEATRIPSVIEGIFHAWFTEILVIDDGSTDNTALLLESLIWNSKIHYLRHITNRGAWAALETGFSFIRANAEQYNWKYLVTFDADWQHDIRDMDRFITAFKKDESLDVVLGSRFIEKTNSNVPFLRKITLFEVVYLLLWFPEFTWLMHTMDIVCFVLKHWRIYILRWMVWNMRVSSSIRLERISSNLSKFR